MAVVFRGRDVSRILVVAAFLVGVGGAIVVLPASTGVTGMQGSDPCAPDSDDTGDSTTAPSTAPDAPRGTPTAVSEDEVLQWDYSPLQPSKSAAKEVTPPSCDAGSSDTMVLEPGDDLSSALNQDGTRVFCITPGDYRDQDIRISTSGSEGQKRWLRYYDPDGTGDEHPWHMADPETLGADGRVVLGSMRLDGASWWVFDRLRFHDRIQVHDGSDHNIFNRLMFYRMPHRDTHGNINIDIENSDHNTVQHSVIGKTQGDFAHGSSPDTIGVMLSDAAYTRIVGNEMFDFYSGDAIQTGQSQSHARGTIVQDNDIYRSDSFDGPMENGIDFKAGPADPDTGSVDGISKEEWVVVENNRLWGEGNNAIFHYPTVSGITVRENIFWDTGGFAYAVPKKEELNRYHHVHDNILYNTGGGFKPRHIQESLYARNVFINAREEDVAWGWFADPEQNTVTRNVFIDTDVSTSQQGNDVSENAYYNSAPFNGDESGRITEGSASAAQHDDATIQIKQITDPQQMTIPNALVTAQSPHADRFNVQ